MSNLRPNEGNIKNIVTELNAFELATVAQVDVIRAAITANAEDIEDINDPATGLPALATLVSNLYNALAALENVKIHNIPIADFVDVAGDYIATIASAGIVGTETVAEKFTVTGYTITVTAGNILVHAGAAAPTAPVIIGMLVTLAAV